MPELPEVETVRCGLEPVLVGATLCDIEVRRPNLRFPFPKAFRAQLKGATVERLNRRAKYLVADLSNKKSLVMHLGMSGRFTIMVPNATKLKDTAQFVQDTGANPKHDHVVFHTSAGATVTYNDPRRFGFMILVDEHERETHKLFKNLGIEPLGNQLSADFLAARAHNKKTDLKAFLMDQRIVAGLGNIYVAEALHRAKLNPTRITSTLATKTGKPTKLSDRLVPAIRDVLQDAIAAGGSTLKDYRAADGALGYFQHQFRVYGREDEKCPRKTCDGRIKKIVQAGRSTFYCSRCQR